jgi:hypothetical protein
LVYLKENENGRAEIFRKSNLGKGERETLEDWKQRGMSPNMTSYKENKV